MLRSNILKLCLFATGLSGIVAEYILSTLATYFLGDSVFQWTMIVSVMLFSMGLGSRLSKYLQDDLLKKFIYIEFLLSILVGYSSLFVYTAASFTIYKGIIIYFLSILIGVLIGMEIPLVIRLNNEFETLRVNVASVIEKDYYGSLAGGIFFAFFGLPYLGLTYTPFVLGFINFLVAFILFIILYRHFPKVARRDLVVFSSVALSLLVFGFFVAKPLIFFGEQQRYTDKVVFSQQSRYQKITITQWKNDYWLYIDGNQQFSTLDEVMYHEPLVHPVMQLHSFPQDILVLGGGDGCAIREILKYQQVKSITLVDLDPAMTTLAKENPIISTVNQHSLSSEKVEIINQDGYAFIEKTKNFFDIIIIDLPDPKTVELGRLYSFEFYKLCYKSLRPEGYIITQAGSPYFATKAFICIDLSLQKAGFKTLPLHNQIITMGEWGWILGNKIYESADLKFRIQKLSFNTVETKWLNKESATLITLFGKNIYPNWNYRDSIEINTIHNPVLYRYYLQGNWDLF
jgi:spermidine synthase